MLLLLLFSIKVEKVNRLSFMCSLWLDLFSFVKPNDVRVRVPIAIIVLALVTSYSFLLETLEVVCFCRLLEL